MANSLRTCLSFVLATCALVACSRRTPEQAAHNTPQALPNGVALAAAVTSERESKSGDGKLDPNDPKHGARKMMGLDVGVFVDGVQASVLRYGDLPPMPFTTLDDGTRRYGLAEYLKAIGVSLDSLKSIHLHGNGDRIASIEGAELQKFADRFKFQFLSGTTGAPVTCWSTDGLKNKTNVQEIRKITLYVTKASALIDPKRGCHVGADGACSDAVPYASGDAVKGTRVYVDGKMVGFVKRRQLTEAMAMGDASERKYNLAKVLAGFGVEKSGIRAVNFVAGDDVIASADGTKFATIAQDFYFELPKHNHGKVRIHAPAGLQAKTESGPATIDADALVSSIQVFKTTTPTVRELTAISEDTDLSVQIASNTAATRD